ncbi:MAG: pyrroline-5-carboxylate reductase [Oscillibacter sp.]|nr:pyrroline-5-carboxylate reductase [Oscillibacter sp.]
MILGFIGTGNMGGALAKAAHCKLDGEQILLANRTPEKAQRLAEKLDAKVTDNAAVAEQANYIFLGVKPHMMEDLLTEIGPILAKRKHLEDMQDMANPMEQHSRFVLVSMAAGLSIARIQELAGTSYPVIRIMPNTPAAIGMGMNFYTCGPGVTGREEKLFLEAMSGAGRFASIPETQMDAASAVAGCGPAFVDLFLEAMADGGVACGLPRAQAIEFAAQMMVGSAMLLLQTGQHPGALKDAVCSPGGSTIQGVRALEEHGFRAAVINAVIAAYEKNRALG